MGKWSHLGKIFRSEEQPLKKCTTPTSTSYKSPPPPPPLPQCDYQTLLISFYGAPKFLSVLADESVAIWDPDVELPIECSRNIQSLTLLSKDCTRWQSNQFCGDGNQQVTPRQTITFFSRLLHAWKASEWKYIWIFIKWSLHTCVFTWKLFYCELVFSSERLQH